MIAITRTDSSARLKASRRSASAHVSTLGVPGQTEQHQVVLGAHQG